MISGALEALSEPIPRMRMVLDVPARPEELVTEIPATVPSSAFEASAACILSILLASTDTAEPVNDDFLAVP